MKINPRRKERQKKFLVRDVLKIEKQASERGLIPLFDINCLLEVFYQVRDKTKEYLKYKVCPVAQLKAIHKAVMELFENVENPSILMCEGLAGRKLDCDLSCGIYLSIVRELKLPVYGVLLPSHTILAWGMPKPLFYFNAMLGNVTKEGISYKPLPDKEFMSTYYNTVGVRFAEIEKYQDAIFFFDKALKCYSLDARLYYHKGVSLAHLGHYKQALHWCKRAIKLDTSDWKAHFNMGVCLALSGKYKEAVNFYSQAAKIHPKDYRIYYYRADALMHLGQLDLAIEDYKKALHICPNDINLRKDYETAIRYSKEP